MNESSVVDTSALGRKRGVRRHRRRGAARSAGGVEIAPCWAMRRGERDLLIEFLHRIQDRYGHISAAHHPRRWQRSSSSRCTEVYEVATFYHHFDVVKEGEAAAAADGARSARRCPVRWPAPTRCASAVERACGAGVRVIGAPCIGRCEHAPAAVVRTQSDRQRDGG